MTIKYTYLELKVETKYLKEIARMKHCTNVFGKKIFAS